MAFRFLLWTVVLVLISAAKCSKEQMQCAPKKVFAKVGSNATLLCRVNAIFDVAEEVVEWTFNGSDVHVWRNDQDDLKTQNPHFKNRTKLFHEEMSKGNVSLQISNVTTSDTGNYTVKVLKKGTTTVTLKVEEPGKDEGHKEKNSASPSPTSPPPRTKWIGGVVVGVAVAALAVVLAFIYKYSRHRAWHRPGAAGEEDENVSA